MKILKRKLHGDALKKLGIHLHAHSHISDILPHVKSTKDRFTKGEFTDLEVEGKVLMKVCLLDETRSQGSQIIMKKLSRALRLDLCGTKKSYKKQIQILDELGVQIIKIEKNLRPSISHGNFKETKWAR